MDFGYDSDDEEMVYGRVFHLLYFQAPYLEQKPIATQKLSFRHRGPLVRRADNESSIAFIKDVFFSGVIIEFDLASLDKRVKFSSKETLNVPNYYSFAPMIYRKNENEFIIFLKENQNSSFVANLSTQTLTKYCNNQEITKNLLK